MISSDDLMIVYNVSAVERSFQMVVNSDVERAAQIYNASDVKRAAQIVFVTETPFRHVMPTHTKTISCL